MDLFLTIDMPFHVLCAMAGLAFGLGSIASVNHRKIHKLSGRITVAAMILLTLSGLAFLADPQFREGINTILAQDGVPRTVFEDVVYLNIAFVAIAVITANGIITGARVWTRVRRSTDNRLYCDWVDWTVTLVTIPVLALFTLVGFQHAAHGNQTALIMASIGLVSVIFQLGDLYTYLRPPAVAGKQWWLLHMAKMLGAIAGVMQAVAVRHATELPLIVVIVIAAGTLPTLIFVSIVYYRRGLRWWLRKDGRRKTDAHPMR